MNNVFDNVITGYMCPNDLLNENKNIRSFNDRYKLMMSKHSSLRHLVTSASNSESLRKEIGDSHYEGQVPGPHRHSRNSSCSINHKNLRDQSCVSDAHFKSSDQRHWSEQG